MADKERLEELARIFIDTDSGESDFEGFDDETILQHSAVVRTLEFMQVCVFLLHILSSCLFKV